tara:strand:+ start:59 stop:574 length:516 start_codon:yes stop_codon:yes gene_type:complete
MKIIEKLTNNLTKEEINQIIKLKNSHWNFGLKSQIEWFKKRINIKKKDIHIFIKNKKNIIGYVQLGYRKFNIKKNSQKYLLFRTLIISKRFRKKFLSKKIMDRVVKIINSKKIICFLTCQKYLVKFYNEYNWKKLKKSEFKILDHHNRLIGMINNPYREKIKKKIIFYYNK